MEVTFWSQATHIPKRKTMTETQSATDTRKDAIESLYHEFFPVVAVYIKKRGGDLEDAKELFQEALVALFERRLNSSFEVDTNTEAYLMGIVKHLWYKDQRRVRHHEIDSIEIAEMEEKKPITERLLHFLESSGQRCMELLQSFYYEKLNMDQISKRFGFSSDRSAATQKFKCLEKVRNQVKQKSLTYEDFID